MPVTDGRSGCSRRRRAAAGPARRTPSSPAASHLDRPPATAGRQARLSKGRCLAWAPHGGGAVMAQVLLLALAVAGCASAVPRTDLRDGPTGTISFTTQSPTGTEFIQGTTTVPPTVISGDLTLRLA